MRCQRSTRTTRFWNTFQVLSLSNKIQINEIVGGPKQYALKLRSLKDNSLKFIRKFRGITLDKKNEDVLNYEKFKSMVLKDPSTSQVMFEYTRLGPDKTSRMLSRAMNKRYRTVNTKGFVNDLVVYPFGYQ